jgi:hypothetical protein
MFFHLSDRMFVRMHYGRSVQNNRLTEKTDKTEEKLTKKLNQNETPIKLIFKTINFNRSGLVLVLNQKPDQN